MPDPRRDRLPFVQSVLHATDFSAASERAFAHALAVALLRGTLLTILHVEKTGDPDWTAFPAVRETLERWRLLQPGSERSAVLEELGVQVEKITLPSRSPSLAINDYIERNPVDLLVVATEGRDGPARWLRSSVAEAVARSSRTLTLFVPADAERNFVALEDGDLSLTNVLVPVDHRPDPGGAIEYARRVADAIGDGVVTITLLHVGDQEGSPELAPADGNGWTFRHLQRAGEPAEQILAAAEELAVDLIVMPTTGHHGVLDALRGSTTERVLRHARCPVLAVPARAA